MKYKKVFVIFISIMFSLGLAGCSRQEDAERTEYTEEVKIPMLLTIDPSTGNKNDEDVITAFNEEYKGRYRSVSKNMGGVLGVLRKTAE